MKSILGAVLALLLTGCGATGTVGTIVKPEPTPIAETRIGMAADETCTALKWVMDDGQSITFDMEGEEDLVSDGPYATIAEVACVLNALNTPDFVITHMDNTSSMDGQQTDTWDGFEARWKYHPDNGMDLTIIDTQFERAE